MNTHIEKSKTALALTIALAASMGGTAVAGANPETPKHALTRVLNGLEHGKTAHVTAQAKELPGPVGTAKGHPIVFKVNGRSYEAYTQGEKPNFHESPARLASEMAIIERPAELSDLPVANAHLNAAKILVENHTHGLAVGFSTGGNSSPSPEQPTFIA